MRQPLLTRISVSYIFSRGRYQQVPRTVKPGRDLFDHADEGIRGETNGRFFQREQTAIQSGPHLFHRSLPGGFVQAIIA